MEAKQTCNLSIPKIALKSTIPCFTNYKWGTLLGNIIRQYLYTLFATTDSPTGVVTIKGSFKISGKIPNLLGTKGVTNDKVEPS